MRAEDVGKPAIYPSYTVDDWEHWDGRWELIEGFPWMWNPAQTLENGEWQIAFEGHEGTFEFDYHACKAKIDFAQIWG